MFEMTTEILSIIETDPDIFSLDEQIYIYYNEDEL